MFRLRLSTALALAVWAVTASPASAQQIVARFEVANFVFSPDGDGVEETAGVNFTLADSASTVSVVVFEDDSVSVVDTLLAPQPKQSGRTDLLWDGRYWDDAPAPDGRYVVTLSVSGATVSDTTVSRAVIVDTGAPAISIDSVTPNPYAPVVDGVPSALDVFFTVTGASPALSGVPPDEVQRKFTQPGGSAFTPDSLAFVPPFQGADGVYSLQWRAHKTTSVANGEYEVKLTIVDQAGHSSSSSHTFYVDSKAPEVKITSPVSGRSYREAPDSLRGWAWDGSGITGVDIQYSSAGPFVPVVTTAVVDDTVFFRAPVADSVTTPGTHKLTVRAQDTVGRRATAVLDVRIDLTAPGTPVLDAFAGAWHTDRYRLTGDFPVDSDAATRLRIYRNGVVIDSLLTVQIERLDRMVALVPGRNAFTATLVDGAGNEGAHSNEVVVTFDLAVGLFLEVPFVPDDEFHVSLAQPARSLSIRLYDMTGNLVVRLDDAASTQFYAVGWDGRTGSGDMTKKGPLLAVASVSYVGGGSESFRELFLFEPNP